MLNSALDQWNCELLLTDPLEVSVCYDTLSHSLCVCVSMNIVSGRSTAPRPVCRPVPPEHLWAPRPNAHAPDERVLLASEDLIWAEDSSVSLKVQQKPTSSTERIRILFAFLHTINKYFMWSSSVCLKLMLLLPKELWTWGNLHRYSDQIKTTTVFLLLCDKYCVWSCVLTYSGCWTEMPLLQWLYMKGHTWTNLIWAPESVFMRHA